MEVILKIYGFNLQKLVPVEMEAVANMLREPKTMGKTGYVYIIQAKCGGPVKIGFSRYPCAKGRLSQIQCTCPFELKIIAEFPNGMIKTEKEIHKKYDKYRLHNEWFDEAILPCIFSEYKEEI
jgi:hypothetical protein